MKNTLFILDLEILILSSSVIYAGNLFYYGGEETIPISYVHNKRALLRQPTISTDDYVERIGARIEIVNSEVNWNNDPRIIYENEDGRLSLPIVSLDNGFEMVLVPEIIVKPKMPSYDMSLLCEKYHLLLEEDMSDNLAF